MSSDRLPIPVPIAIRLQEMRTRVAPVLVFAGAGLMAVMLWRDAISPAMLVGEVAVVKSSVNSPVGANIRRLSAQRLQHVKAGDVIAELVPNDPRQSLDLLKSELSLLRAESGTDETAQDVVTGARREALDYERLRLDWMMEKVALVTAEGEARRAALELDIAKGMSDSPGASKRYLQEAELTKQSADAQVAALAAIVEGLAARIETLRPPALAAAAPPPERWRIALDGLEQRMRALDVTQSVMPLRAPIDGIVTEVLRRTGENVVQGELLVVITATQPESIVGYLRQPFPVEPVVGQPVEVRTHGRNRLMGMALVTRVGAHFETILNPALHPALTAEVGLPVEVSLPANLRLRPGELVSLVIHPSEGDAL